MFYFIERAIKDGQRHRHYIVLCHSNTMFMPFKYQIFKNSTIFQDMNDKPGHMKSSDQTSANKKATLITT